MEFTEIHSKLLNNAFEKVLGQPEIGTMSFTRCLPSDLVRYLACDRTFSPCGWNVYRVATENNLDNRTITADRAVEIREAKEEATLLLVDTEEAGAGMDGIYSAAREVYEKDLFNEAIELAKKEVLDKFKRKDLKYAEDAVKKARRLDKRFAVSFWTEFNFFVQIIVNDQHPAELLYLLGLWPVKIKEDLDHNKDLERSRFFVERLLGSAASGLTILQRIESLRLIDITEQQKKDLQSFLHSAGNKPILNALTELSDKRHLWVNELKVEDTIENIQSIELVPWRNNRGRVANWSGLVRKSENDDDPLEFILKPEARSPGEYSKLEIRWKVRPQHIEKGSVEYNVAVITEMDEEICSKTLLHTGRGEEKCYFTNDDFSMLNDDVLITAKVVVSVVGNEQITQESEEFIIRYGEPYDTKTGGVGRKVRTFSEGLIELNNKDILASPLFPIIDKKGFAVLRIQDSGKTKSYRVFSPPLIREVISQWYEKEGEIGRWRVRVRVSGERISRPEFIPFETPASGSWERVNLASKKMAEYFYNCQGVGQVYYKESKTFELAKEYILAWAALLEEEDCDSQWALANTVEVQTLSGKTIGLIVLPSHPLRVSWHIGYDMLVFHVAFTENVKPSHLREDFKILDGAMFPAFLPGLEKGSTFIFADTLGFHCVGLVPDYDKEPKASVAILARTLGETETADSAPTVGQQSAQVLGKEIFKYIECHKIPKTLRIHSLRAGDGLTVSKSLGLVQRELNKKIEEKEDEIRDQIIAPTFELEFYPSPEQKALAGRFISELREKKRRGAGIVADEDRWMLDSISLPGGINIPKLRWSRKDSQEPKIAAHLAIAFDTFDSKVVPIDKEKERKDRPFFAYGLMSFFEREYSSLPHPVWKSSVLDPLDGEKHPADRTHTDRLIRLHRAINKCVSKNLDAQEKTIILKTEISPEKAHSLRELHRLCDWVITLDRNAGIEYFDSPRDNKEIYDAYVIDCVPEREDLGCLQLITSTSNMDEVRNLIDGALDQMGLSRSRRNAEFLMEHLKALSGRLAIRLTGQKAPTSELIALALCHANCQNADITDDCWTSLKNGFFVPIDDIRDLLPSFIDIKEEDTQDEEKATRPDILYVSLAQRQGLIFRFIEVKYRRHLITARSPETLKKIKEQVELLHRRWNGWYINKKESPTILALRRAKLARILRFYADKARRHSLSINNEQQTGISETFYKSVIAEIDRMIEKGVEYTFIHKEKGDRGWIFCPEYSGSAPLEISPEDWETKVFLFGPGLLPDTIFSSDRMLSDKLQTNNIYIIEKESMTVTDESFKNNDVQKNESFPRLLLGKDILSDTETYWSLSIKGNPHLLIAGLPGMGKTTCLLNICQQMHNNNICPIIFSYHQDIDERLMNLGVPVRYIDYHGLTFNPLQVIDRESRLAYLDVAGALRDIFMAIFPELGELQGERIRKAIKESFIEYGWDDPNADTTEPPFSRFVEILRAEPKPDRGLKTLLARLEELEDYNFFELAESNESLWDANQPIVIRIHTTQNDNLQKAFASLVFYSLYKNMFRRGIQERITHGIIFDEAHRAARLKLIPTMAKECRKYGISLVLASQEARDFDISLFSAIANYLVLRLNETDAKALVRNVASSDQERMLIDRIKQMERFKALYFSEGRKKPSMILLSPLP